MQLTPGTRLGPYEIQSAIGAGGMGEVYRARDTRLNRTVAVKILHPELSSSPERKQRFEHEARAISALSHPNICHLYDVGSHDGLEFMVIEYLEGQTLADRLRKGPLPHEQVLAIGIEIADALEHAHRQGTIHRDLKPGNIMLTKSGAKLMDFGLAKATAQAVGVTGSMLPTITRSEPLTAQGTILGTLQYMSSEQVEGKAIDARSDIFSLGCVLYEMATGKPTFSGGTPASIMAAVLTAEPQSICAQRPSIPEALDAVIRVALAKDPEERWQSAHDVRLQLKWIEAHPVDTSRLQAKAVPRLRGWAPWLLSLVLLLTAAALAIATLRRASPAVQVTRSSLLPPPKSYYVAHNFALSPDGRRLAFVAVGDDEKNNLWVRSLNSSTAQILAGTEEAMYPFWSPDSGSIGFFAEGKLKTIEVGGGAIRVLADAPLGRGGTWNREDTIVFAPFILGPLKRVPAAGGAAVPVTRILREGSGQAHRWPFFLPDGRHFLFFVDWSSPADQQVDGIYVGSLDSPDVKLVSAEITGTVQYSSGRLLFVQNRSLMAQRFDLRRLQLAGSATVLVEQELEKDSAFSNSNFSTGANSTLVFYSAVESASELLWYDRTGNEIGRVPGSGFKDPRLSPDHRLLAMSYDPAKNGQHFIHVHDLARGLTTRVTERGADENPTWSPDGRSLTYVTSTGKEYQVYQVAADGSGSSALLMRGAKMIPNDWSPDGKRLVFMDFQTGLPHVAIYSVEDHSRTLLYQGAEAQFSPDGKWLAYQGAGARSGIVVRRFPDGPLIQICDRGAQLRWSQDGSEIFYMALDRKLMTVKFDSRNGSALSAPQPLFQTRVIAPNFVVRQYDVSADGKRFIVNSLPPAGTIPLTLLTNWNSQNMKE